jgi:hypothetical protein
VDLAQEALKMGAGGYLVKSDAASELLPAIEAVLRGKQFVSVSLAGHVLVNTKGELADVHRVPRASANVAISRRHEVALYPDDTFLVDSFARIVESALKIGNAVIVIATKSHQAGIVARLRAGVVDVEAVVKLGNYFACDVDDTLSAFMVNNLPDPVRFRKSTGDLVEQAAKGAQGEPRRVAACREYAPTMLAKGDDEATIRIERLWDEIARSYGVDILCGYLRGAFPGNDSSPIFQRICAENSGVRRD